MQKLAKWIPGLLLGTLASAIAAFVHADRIRVSGQPIYFGLVLAPAFLFTLQRWLMNYYQNRIAGISFAIAWLAVTIRLSFPNSDGDYALSSTWYSTAYLGVTALILSMSAVLSPKSKIPESA